MCNNAQMQAQMQGLQLRQPYGMGPYGALGTLLGGGPYPFPPPDLYRGLSSGDLQYQARMIAEQNAIHADYTELKRSNACKLGKVTIKPGYIRDWSKDYCRAKKLSDYPFWVRVEWRLVQFWRWWK